MFNQIVLIVLAGAVLFLFGKQIIKGFQTSRFRHTDGVVISSELSGDLGVERYTYRPMIHYEYTVDGIRYQNTCYSTTYLTYYKKRVERILKEYQPGKTIPVYYNPEHPGEAVLKPGIEPIRLAGMIIMMGLLIYAIVKI